MKDGFKKKEDFKRTNTGFDIDVFVGTLRSSLKSVQVTRKSVIERARILPSHARFPGSPEDLIEKMETTFGTVSFTAGEPPRIETYITLPSSKEVPTEIAERVVAIVTSRFANRETIPIDEMRAALAEEGIDVAALDFNPPVSFFRSLPTTSHLTSETSVVFARS